MMRVCRTLAKIDDGDATNQQKQKNECRQRRVKRFSVN